MDRVDHSDVICWLLPHRGEGFDGAAFATAKPENKARFVAARHDLSKRRNIVREERAGTELPAEYGQFDNTDCLVFLFSHGARTSAGIVGGCAENADFSLQDIPGVSKYHFAITFDYQHLPTLRDLGSRGGTKLIYNGEKGRRLSNFDWPLVGPSIASGKPPILNITDRLQFKVIIPDRDYRSSEHIDRVKNFHSGHRDHENLFASMIIQSAQGTQLPSKQQTPTLGARSRAVLYKKQIGKGVYGVVTYVWNLTTREEYVVKKPHPNLIKKCTYNEAMWREEAEIMRNVSHEHIVAFRNFSLSPYPRLEFEYIRGGSLKDYTDLSTYESTQVLCQLSSALEYLHNQNPSIGHRDIKAENILVVSRTETEGMYVKFADFGLSKAADVLKTCCGTVLWAAPEIHSKIADPAGTADDTYSVAVDIWSLGAMVASLLCGHPTYEERWATDPVAWIRAFQSHVEDSYKENNSDLLYLIMDSMLVEDPDERSSADYVTNEAMKLLVVIAARSDKEGTFTPRTSHTVDTQSFITSERHSEGSGSADGINEEGRSRKGSVGSDAACVAAWESQILETTEIVPRNEMVTNSLGNAHVSRKAGSASTDCDRATRYDSAEIVQFNKKGQNAFDNRSTVADCVLADHQVKAQKSINAISAAEPPLSSRKRHRSDVESPLRLSGSFTCLSPSHQQHRIRHRQRVKEVERRVQRSEIL